VAIGDIIEQRRIDCRGGGRGQFDGRSRELILNHWSSARNR
jgi:hypothetical protein